MRAGILCLLLLSACDDKVPYDYGLTWTCLSPEGCERAEELRLFDRLNVYGDTFFFLNARDSWVDESAQRLGSETVPAGCWLLYGFSTFGRDLEPSKLCSVSGGFDLELLVPNRDPSTYSHWLVEARELGVI
jgi:hypothetical protein